MPPITVDQPVVDSGLADGLFSGASRGHHPLVDSITAYPPNSDFTAVPPITAILASGYTYATPPITKRIVYVNGIGTNRDTHGHTVMLLAVLTGARIVGIYNQSGNGRRTNIVFDLIQCLGDKLGLSDNPATNTLADSIFHSCVTQQPLNVVAHSQGALITSNAVSLGIGKLLDHFGRQDPQVNALMNRRPLAFSNPTFPGGSVDVQQIELESALTRRILPGVRSKLNDLVSVQTFGGAGYTFPDGPVYRHVNNGWDPVSNSVGQGAFFHGGGRDAQQVQIERNSGSRLRDIADHSIDSVYLQPSNYYVDRNGRRVDSTYVPVDLTMLR